VPRFWQAMPPPKSRYSRPSASQIRAPQARLTTEVGPRDGRAARSARAHAARDPWKTRSSTRTGGVSHYRNARREGRFAAHCAVGGLSRIGRCGPSIRSPALHLALSSRRSRPCRPPPGGRSALRRQHAARPAADRAARDRRGSARADPVLPARRLPRSSSGAIAAYNGVEPENVVLGAGADDLLMLCARSYAGPGDLIAIADEPSYPLYRVAAWVTGAGVGDDGPVLTFACRPHNPTGPWSTSRPRARSSSTRRTSSMEGRQRCRSSATTSSSCARSRRRSA